MDCPRKKEKLDTWILYISWDLVYNVFLQLFPTISGLLITQHWTPLYQILYKYIVSIDIFAEYCLFFFEGQ